MIEIPVASWTSRTNSKDDKKTRARLGGRQETDCPSQRQSFLLCKSCACGHAQSCPTLRPHGLQPARLLGHGIFQTRILEWVAISSSRGSSWLEIEPTFPASSSLAGTFSPTVTNTSLGGRSLQSCLTLCDPTDCSPPGSSVHAAFLRGNMAILIKTLKDWS